MVQGEWKSSGEVVSSATSSGNMRCLHWGITGRTQRCHHSSSFVGVAHHPDEQANGLQVVCICIFEEERDQERTSGASHLIAPALLIVVVAARWAASAKAVRPKSAKTGRLYWSIKILDWRRKAVRKSANNKRAYKPYSMEVSMSKCLIMQILETGCNAGNLLAVSCGDDRNIVYRLYQEHMSDVTTAFILEILHQCASRHPGWNHLQYPLIERVMINSKERQDTRMF